MKLAVSGFVSEQAGSVASANALLLRELLLRGHKIHFFSKASFVDPRPAVGNLPGFQFFNVTNAGPDRFRQRLSRVPVAGFLAGQLDASTYNRSLVREMTRNHAVERYDLCFWMGDYARGRTPGLPTVCFVQGAPGTDARSVLRQSSEVKRLAGPANALKWQIMARIRLSPLGLPPFKNADRFIVGSSQSKRTLHSVYGIADERISSLPYPIDLELFHLETPERGAETVKAQSGAADGDKAHAGLRICWLGRIVPRKRLDLFLEGAALAIRKGIELRLTIVGGVGFIRGYEKMIEAFPFGDRLTWKQSVPRQEVPALLRAHDVLVQPSDEEDFGSSVAEAQACGLPVILGRTNGNADYLCSQDIHLKDDRPETLAGALHELSLRKAEGRWGDPGESRRCAEEHFSLETVTTRLIEILESVIGLDADDASSDRPTSTSTVLRIGLLSAAFPPDFDGIGDYTYWLAKTLAQSGIEASVWTSIGRQRVSCESVKVNPFFETNKPQSVKALPALLAKGPPIDWLIVEYNPFGFGRWGYCPWLVSTLRQLKRSRSCRVAVMFHETQVPSRPLKLWIMRQWQNRQLRSLSRLADVIFVSTTRWESEIKEVAPKAVCHHLPVGSNLPCSQLSWETAREKLGISSQTLVLGMFGSSHPSRMTDWMSAAVRGAASVQEKLVVLYVGKDGKVFREVSAGFPFMDEGPLPAEAAADRMRAVDLLISPFIDGISTRRGSAIAGFQHGVAVASTLAQHTDALLRDGAPANLILAPRDDRDPFVEKTNQWIVFKWKKGERGREEMEAYFQRHFAWPVIARRTLECLG